ncbi:MULTISPECIES: hypothetical protein [Sphingomonas]|uniref:hypothetical protein n=1 Tax=Sphingomonas TaxID=13687 RepID=UPI0012698FD1|nr:MULTISPECIES: hypothetical protein [Sphingomonas]
MLDFQPLDQYRSSAPTYAVGQHSGSTDETRLRRRRVTPIRREPLPPGTLRKSAVASALLLSPVLLVIAHWIVIGSTNDEYVHGEPWARLFLAGTAAMALSVADFLATSRRLVGVRTLVLAAALVGMIGYAVGYTRGALSAHAHASASPAERVLVSYENCGKNCRQAVYQRADGTLLNGLGKRPVAEYAPACARVQTLVGERGFGWLRVLERSRSPERHQLFWPVRASECFSDIPLSQLPR